MTPQPFDDLPRDWLAAYADGELSPADRARVERWLAEDSDARELLDAQESLGPQNADLWDAARPPAPSAGQWERAFDPIGLRTIAPRRAWAEWLGSLALLATAASLFLALPGRPPCADAPAADVTDESAPATAPDVEPYVMASADEIRILSLPEAAAALLLIGEHPMGDSVLVLAERGEIAFFGVGNDLAGRFPDDPGGPDAPPMIWAPRDP